MGAMVNTWNVLVALREQSQAKCSVMVCVL